MSIPEINKVLKNSLVELDKDPGARARGQCGSRVITVEGFQALVPGLGDAQAKRLLSQAIISKEEQEQAAVSMCDTFKLVKKIDSSVSNLTNSLRFLDKVNTWTADKMQEIQADVQKGKRTSEDLMNKLLTKQQDMSNQLEELQRQQAALSKMVQGLTKEKGMKRNTGVFTSEAKIVATTEQHNGTEVGACSTFFDGN
jgi:DNA-directed RNA polymerase subunit F